MYVIEAVYTIKLVATTVLAVYPAVKAGHRLHKYYRAIWPHKPSYPELKGEWIFLETTIRAEDAGEVMLVPPGHA